MPKHIPKEIAHKVAQVALKRAQQCQQTQCWTIKDPEIGLYNKRWMARYCVWITIGNKIPQSCRVLPTCGNKLCVNPQHLALSRPNCNFLDSRNHYHRTQAKNRQFSEAQVREILEYAKDRKPGNPDKVPHLMVKSLAKRFQCSKSVMHSILSGRRYKFVTRNQEQ